MKKYYIGIVGLGKNKDTTMQILALAIQLQEKLKGNIIFAEVEIVIVWQVFTYILNAYHLRM